MQHENSKQQMFQPNPDVNWTLEHSGAFVIISGRNSIHLSMEEAILWDLIHRFNKPAEIISMIEAIFQQATSDAQTMFENAVARWKENKMIG